MGHFYFALLATQYVKNEGTGLKQSTLILTVQAGLSLPGSLERRRWAEEYIAPGWVQLEKDYFATKERVLWRHPGVQVPLPVMHLRR